MALKLDMEKIAARMGAKRLGKVHAGSGFFGAMQLAAEVQARFRTPATGGRPTDPTWTETRQVRFKRETLARLERLAAEVSKRSAVAIEPLQLAAILIEATMQLTAAETMQLVKRWRDRLPTDL
ncbi:MAG: hypothetical protein AAB562_00140 [Patescibacteria group bacterium]